MAATTMTYRQLIQDSIKDEYWGLHRDHLGWLHAHREQLLAVLRPGRAAVRAGRWCPRTARSTTSPVVDYSALTEQEKRGLVLFDGKGKCTACHNGPELGAGSDLFKEDEEGGLVERMPMAHGVALYDNGFYNIGVDAPRSRTSAPAARTRGGNPLSFSRQEKDRAAGGNPPDDFETDPNTFESNPGTPVDPNERDAADGSFKTPPAAQPHPHWPVLPQRRPGDPAPGGRVLQPRRRPPEHELERQLRQHRVRFQLHEPRSRHHRAWHVRATRSTTWSRSSKR